MKLVVQRVLFGEVKVEGKIVGSVNSGLFVLVGIKGGDIIENAKYLADKLLKLRILSDENGKMNLSVIDKKNSILAVSQFTLYANTQGGNRPSFIDAGDPEEAEEIYNYFIQYIRNKGVTVKTGEFGAYMEISVKLDGPVTIILEK